MLQVLTRKLSNVFLLSRICFASVGPTLAKNRLNYVAIFSWPIMSVFLTLIFCGNDDLYILAFPIRSLIVFHVFFALPLKLRIFSE